MSLETGTYINSLVATNPPGSDPIAQADDHIRLIKAVLKNTFPSITGPITVSDTQINDAVLNGGGGGGSGSGGGTNVYTGIDFVDTLPGTGDYVGQLVFLSSDNTMYSWDGAQWVAVALTPDTPPGIEIVDALADPVPPDGTTVLLRTDNKLYTVVNGAWVDLVVTQDVAQTVADGSITTAKFAQGVRPLEVVDALPTTNNSEGRMVYLTTDNKVYRYDGSAFVSSVAAGDLTGEITADQIAANAITAGKIAAGAISADQIAANAISTDKLAAGAVTAEKIAVGAISADFIAANSITGDKIAANTITSGKIQAGAIGTSQLSAGAVTAEKISSGTVITSSAQIGTGVIGTANIADANITTLKIANNAVIVPVAATRTDTISATGDFNSSSFTSAISASITLPQAATLTYLYSAKQGYYGYAPFSSPQVYNTYYKGELSTRIEIYIDGSLIRTHGGSAVENTQTIAGTASLAAGTHTVEIKWKGQKYDANAYVALMERTLALLGAMK